MKKYRILLIDDGIEWLKSHQNMLAQLFPEGFFEIDTARSAVKGFEKALVNLANPYDFITVDLEMERISDESYAGVWLIKNLINRAEYKNTKFIIISGAYNIVDVAEKYGTSYIAKSSLIQTPMTLKYKIIELLNLTKS